MEGEGSFAALKSSLDVGDIVGAIGTMKRTEKGAGFTHLPSFSMPALVEEAGKFERCRGAVSGC